MIFRRSYSDSISQSLAKFFLLLVVGVVLFLLLGLIVKSRPILMQKSLWELFSGDSWRPLRGEFGFFPFIISTVVITVIALVLAVPPCLLAAVYLSEYSSRRMQIGFRPILEVLAAIPSVIYGLWGVLVIVPGVRTIGHSLGHPNSGYTLISGGIVLAIMVLPFIISISMEVLLAVSAEARLAALALGCTRWETTRHVVMRHASRGFFAAILLGFSRAFGETIAVMMVIGNVAKMPHSLFDPAYTLPALIANNYGEMMSIPLYDSAIMLAALILMVIIIFINIVAHQILSKLDVR
jgi:phosphate transport system permease protein